MELFLILPFLVGRVIWKRLLFTVIFSVYPSLYVLLDVISWLFCLINVLEYSVKVPFRQDKYFRIFCTFCEFLGSGLLVRVHFIA